MCRELFVTFNCEIIIYSQEVAKVVESRVSFTHLPPMLTSYKAVVEYQNQEIDIGPLLLTTDLILFSPFLSPHSFMCVYAILFLCRFV